LDVGELPRAPHATIVYPGQNRLHRLRNGIFSPFIFTLNFPDSFQIKMSTEKITLKAPSLGATLCGSLDKESDIALFRGIPYANVSKRWTHSETANSLHDGFDATRFGYRCNQLDGMVLVSGGTNDDLPGDDEFKCLNLNIATPKEALENKDKPLPVMVWIHG
jgi:hypothetical protein